MLESIMVYYSIAAVSLFVSVLIVYCTGGHRIKIKEITKKLEIEEAQLGVYFGLFFCSLAVYPALGILCKPSDVFDSLVERIEAKAKEIK